MTTMSLATASLLGRGFRQWGAAYKTQAFFQLGSSSGAWASDQGDESHSKRGTPNSALPASSASVDPPLNACNASGTHNRPQLKPLGFGVASAPISLQRTPLLGALSQNKGRAHGPMHVQPMQVQPMQVRPMHVQQRTFMSMDSIKDSFKNPRHKVSNALMAAQAGVFALTTLNPSLAKPFILVNYLVASGGVHRLLTAPFLHSGLIHLAFDLLALQLIGKTVEENVGHNTYMAIYATAAVSSGLAFFMFYPLNAMSYGSSGTMLGLFGSYVTYTLMNRSVLGISTSGSMTWILQLVALNVGLNLLLGGNASLDMTHMAGLAGASAFTYLFGPRYVYQSGAVVNRPIIPWFR